MSLDPYYADDSVTVYHGDNREVLASLPDESLDACVTDPPYELAFMGRRWDSTGIAYDVDLWREVMRVLKPGGHLLAFGGTRTWHRLAVAIEDAGFEVRDNIAYLHDGGLPGPMCWAYGSGFPKSLDVYKAITKAAGADAAEQWQGWGTALKPAHEPIVVARKPLMGTVAENVLTHGTGALNVDGCRIAGEVPSVPQPVFGVASGVTDFGAGTGRNGSMSQATGRWPANVILDESQAAELDRQSGDRPGMATQRDLKDSKGASNGIYSKGIGAFPSGVREGYNDTGGASRFFYVPKANASERPKDGDTAHPTVKPLDLMRYLVRLVTPPGGTVLEPFAGSGTTLEACVVEGFHVIGIELTEDYLPLIVQRVSKPIAPVMF